MNDSDKKKKGFLVLIFLLIIVFFILFFLLKPFSLEIAHVIERLSSMNKAGVIESVDYSSKTSSTTEEISTSTPDQTSSTTDQISTSTADGQTSTLVDQIIVTALDLASTSTPDQIATSADEIVSTSSDQVSSSTSDQTSTSTFDQVSTSSIKQIIATSSLITPLSPKINTQLAIRSISSPILKGTFHSGVIPILVTFNKKVVVSGNPKLILSTGNPETTAVDLKFNFGNQLYFLYHIVPGNSTVLLDYFSSSAIDLNGGKIRDVLGNDAVLDLPNPDSHGSLSDRSKITIETEL